MNAEAATGAAERPGAIVRSMSRQVSFMVGVGWSSCGGYGIGRWNVTDKDEIEVHTEFIV
jgi:hypothetical protein